jgi:hypothetical protein
MDNYIAISKGHGYVEGVLIRNADSSNVAIFKAGKRMLHESEELLIIDTVENLKEEFETCSSGIPGGCNFIAEDGGSIYCGYDNNPLYDGKLHPIYDSAVCIAAKRLLTGNYSRIFVGEKLPSLSVKASCYYCGDEPAMAYITE